MFVMYAPSDFEPPYDIKAIWQAVKTVRTIIILFALIHANSLVISLRRTDDVTCALAAVKVTLFPTCQFSAGTAGTHIADGAGLGVIVVISAAAAAVVIIMCGWTIPVILGYGALVFVFFAVVTGCKKKKKKNGK